jgi:hypothetical protein
MSSRNYYVDVILGLLATILTVSSLLLWVVLPQGYFPSRLVWLEIHKWSGLAVTVTVIVHLGLHWRWLLSMTRRQLSRGARRPPPVSVVGDPTHTNRAVEPEM